MFICLPEKMPVNDLERTGKKIFRILQHLFGGFLSARCGGFLSAEGER
jgi:hypothetical protein